MPRDPDAASASASRYAAPLWQPTFVALRHRRVRTPRVPVVDDSEDSKPIEHYTPSFCGAGVVHDLSLIHI